MDTSQDLLQEETLVIINFTFFIFTFLPLFLFLILLPQSLIHLNKCTTDVHYGSFRICHQAFGGI